MLKWFTNSPILYQYSLWFNHAKLELGFAAAANAGAILTIAAFFVNIIGFADCTPIVAVEIREAAAT